MKIYVDADACPVRDIIISEGTNAEIPVILVTSFSHFSNVEQPSGVETKFECNGSKKQKAYKGAKAIYIRR